MSPLSRFAPLLVAAALVVPEAAPCQDRAPASSAMAIAVGLSDFHQRDQYLSPVTYRGTILTAGALFERRSARTLLAFEATVATGRANSGALPRDVLEHVGRLSVTVLRALGDRAVPGRRFVLWAGGGLSTFGSITEFRATDAAYAYTYTDMSWYWSHSVDLTLRGELRGPSHVLSLQLSSPAARLVSRPNNGKYFNADNQRVQDDWPRAIVSGKAEFLWDHLVLFGEAEYRRPLGGRLQLRAAYDFAYASSDRPLPLGMYMNRLLVGLLFPL